MPVASDPACPVLRTADFVDVRRSQRDQFNKLVTHRMPCRHRLRPSQLGEHRSPFRQPRGQPNPAVLTGLPHYLRESERAAVSRNNPAFLLTPSLESVEAAFFALRISSPSNFGDK